MKLFLSFSGERSREVASRLAVWLPNLLPGVEPWVSSHGVPPGANWRARLQKELTDAEFGIVCLSKENRAEPWVLFEAGALHRAVGERVVPYLLDLEPDDLPDPLRSMEAAAVTEEDTLAVLLAINRSNVSAPLPEAHLTGVFRLLWPDLERELARVTGAVGPPSSLSAFVLINKAHSRCLRVSGRSDTGSVRLARSTMREEQLWSLHEVRPDRFAIVNHHSGKCLDVKGPTENHRELVYQFKYVGEENQMWRFELNSDGSYRIRPGHCDLCLGLIEKTLRQLDEDDSDNQRWWLQPVPLVRS